MFTLLSRDVLGSIGVFVLYFVSAKLGLEYAVISKTVTLLWPPSGIALAAVLLGGYRVWPGIALGAFVSNNLSNDLSIASLSIITIGNTLEPLLGAFLLSRQKNFSLALNNLSDVLQLILLAAFGSTVIAATLGTVGLLVSNEIVSSSLSATWLTWWLGDGMGVLVICPVFLSSFSQIAANRAAFPSKTVFEFLILISALMAIGLTIFNSPELAGQGHFYISLTLFPFAIWGSLRFGPPGAAGVALTASIIAIQGTTKGTGPFALESKVDSLFLWCLFADLMAITGLIIAALDSCRKDAIAALRKANESLDRQVMERTNALIEANLELHGNLAERRRFQLEMNQIAEERQKMIGQELHDSLGQQLTGIAFLVSSLDSTLKAKSAPEANISENISYQVNEAMMTLRALSRGLYPMTLETGGLAYAIRNLSEHIQASSDVLCVVQCATNGFEFDKTIALNLYRIAQEAVSNALRHGRAKQIEIKLSRINKHYLLRIDDNGAGFLGTNNHRAGLGLRSMRNRAHLIGSTIEFESNSSGGASVIIEGPINYFGNDNANRI